MVIIFNMRLCLKEQAFQLLREIKVHLKEKVGRKQAPPRPGPGGAKAPPPDPKLEKLKNRQRRALKEALSWHQELRGLLKKIQIKLPDGLATKGGIIVFIKN